MFDLELVVYGLVQGGTEFLPVSSSAHLFALERLFDWPDTGRTLAVSAHVGTFAAVVLHYRRDVAQLFRGAVGFFDPVERKGSVSREAAGILLATIPLFFAGALVALHVPAGVLARFEVLATAMAGGAILLLCADRGWLKIESLPSGLPRYLFVGLMQTLALIPGMSRAGAAMTGSLIVGFNRADATRLALLLGMPAILGAGIVEGLELWDDGDPVLTWAVGIVTLVSFLAALASITLLVRWVRNRSFLPFVVYRLALAGGLVVLAALW